MNNLTSARELIRKYPYAVLVVLAIAMVSALAAVESSGVLPFEGQATPMYGPMPTPGVRKTAVPRKPSLKQHRRLQRQQRSSSSASSIR